MKRSLYFLFPLTMFLGCQKELEFPPVAAPATIITMNPTAITGTSANLGGAITSSIELITARGTCYSSTRINPTTSDSLTTDGTGDGNFISYLTRLQTNTTYYARAYAISAAGTIYGQPVSFVTKSAGGTIVSLTTSAPANITFSTVTSGGNIISDGGKIITERGICYGISAAPLATGDKIISGNGTGMFSTDITDLLANTTYYIRAYAINSDGTFYGNELSFITTAGRLPTVITSPIFTITSVSGISGGDIIAANGSAITAKGICYSVNFNPTIADRKVTGGYGPGFFVCGMSGLIPATTYYVRAFATNSAGTAYGNQVSFVTKI